MKIKPSNRRRGQRSNLGFSLEELVMSLAIATISIGAIVAGHLLSFQTTEWTAYSAAADSLAHQRMEQTRAARWNTMIFPAVDELATANFPVVDRNLDVPVRKDEVNEASVFTSIDTVSINPALRRVRVDVVWSYLERGPFTNTTIAFRSPDQ